MKKFTCIVCPNGCELTYDEESKTIKGNKCPRGQKYGLDEMTCPKRSLTSSVKTTVIGYPVISVRTNGDIKKELISKAMQIINKVIINEILPINSIVISNILDTGIDVITTTNMEEK